MGFANAYLAKHSPGKAIITKVPEKDLNFIAVIPAFDESGLIKSLDSLYSSAQPRKASEIIVVINWPYDANTETVKRNLEFREKAERWAENHVREKLDVHFISLAGKNKKNSGVGFARKAGMDEAIHRFNYLDNPEGIIYSLDADVTVEKNYFTATRTFLDNNPQLTGCNIYFEHPLDEDFPEEVIEAIIQYELHMRYYVNAFRYAGHPNAFHAVGSAFAVRAIDYCRQGGISKRQAGEDFYFLQKLFDLGNFAECNATCVYPSPRPSLRVPFGTGPAVSNFIKSGENLKTYNLQLFEILKSFLVKTPSFYSSIQKNEFSFPGDLDPVIASFLRENNFQQNLAEIYENSSGPGAFLKRFFRWMNMFRVLKFLNSGKKYYPDLPVFIATADLLEKLNIKNAGEMNGKQLLETYRGLDRNK